MSFTKYKTPPMTDRELDAAIRRAHYSGDFRLADDLETEKKQRETFYRERKEMEAERQPDLSRRSFKG